MHVCSKACSSCNLIGEIKASVSVYEGYRSSKVDKKTAFGSTQIATASTDI